MFSYSSIDMYYTTVIIIIIIIIRADETVINLP